MLIDTIEIERDEAITIARAFGQQIVDLTGNLESPSAAKFFRRVGFLERKPKYSIVGTIFASEARGRETLTASIVDVTDSGHVNLQGPMVLIQTSRSEGGQTVKRPKLYLCPSFFDIMPEEDWKQFEPAVVAAKLHRIGTLLLHGSLSLRGSKTRNLVGPSEFLLTYGDMFDNAIKLILHAVLVASDKADPNKILAYRPRTPTQSARVLPIGFAGGLSPAVQDLIDMIGRDQLLVSLHENALVVTPNEMFLSAAGYNIVDRLKWVSTATHILEQAGYSVNDLACVDMSAR